MAAHPAWSFARLAALRDSDTEAEDENSDTEDENEDAEDDSRIPTQISTPHRAISPARAYVHIKEAGCMPAPPPVVRLSSGVSRPSSPSGSSTASASTASASTSESSAESDEEAVSEPVRPVRPALVSAAEDAVDADVDADTSAVDADALLDGAWETAARPQRTSAMEPWARATVCIGASILPFATDPQHDRVYFWLGKERKVLAWGAGSNRWSDFGGGRARGDVDPAATAAREFVQETAGCMRYFDADGSGLRTRCDDIAASLRAGEYLIKLETALGDAAATEATGAGEGPIRLFVTYVVQVPWDPRAIMRFAHCRALLSGLHKQLIRVPLEHAEEEALRPADPALRASRERWLLYHPAVRQRTRTVLRALLYGVDGVDGADEGEERVPVVDSVNLDYIEKECLDLWSLPQLRRALQYDGNLSNRDGGVESLRPSFMTTLLEALDELRGRHPLYFDDAPSDVYPAVTF